MIPAAMPASTSFDSLTQRNELLSHLNMYLKSSRFADVALHCDNECVLSHRVILAAGAGYFERVFTQSEKVSPVAGLTNVILKDVRADVMRHVIDFIYTGQLNVPVDRIDAFLALAKTLQLRGLDRKAIDSVRQPSVAKPAPKSNIPLSPETTPPKQKQNVFASPANRMGGIVAPSGFQATATKQPPWGVDVQKQNTQPTVALENLEPKNDHKKRNAEGPDAGGEKVTRIVPITILEDDTGSGSDNVS